ncbi:AAA family ATPase, partial [candidate division WWE3 bacterium CG_4_9_14_3_um_filter_43_9]
MSLKTDNFSHIPLADRVRPQTSDQFVGQEHLIGKDKPLRLMIEKGQIFSLIFWGPPGSGKTTLARIIAQATNSNFAEHSATASGVAQVRQVVAEARERLKGYAQKTILFIDEIHRFSKAQQDAFLPHVENGTITLIGATTENPSFEVIPPLLSRCRVLVLKPLTEEHLRQIITQALDDQPNGLGKLKKTLSEEAFDFLIKQAAGDARIALNALEVAATLISQKKTI